MTSRLLTSALMLSAIVAFVGDPVHGGQGQPPQTQGAAPTLDEQQKARWMKEHSNWGRWGADDELGTLNLITPEKRQRALALARTGTVVSLMRRIVLSEPLPIVRKENRPTRGEGAPFFDVRFRSVGPGEPGAGYSFDMQSFAYHGGVYTHLDGLCHISYEGRLYNGFRQDQIVDPEKGCTRMGIQALKTGIVTRGVLVDFLRLKGVSSLPPAARLRPQDVEAWEKMANVRISAGDALFLYTGWKDGAPNLDANYDPSMITLLKARDVALVGAERPAGDHQLNITALGGYLIDNADLGALAETAARLKHWEFLLVIAPIPTPGATGSLVNPLAFF